MKYTVFDYLNLKPTDKLKFFMETRSSLSFLPSYWVNFENVKSNLEKFDCAELYALDFLKNKSNDVVDAHFRSRPEALLLIPYLLGIRDDKFEKPISERKLKVQGLDETYILDFKNIEVDKIEKYLEFLHDSKLDWVLTQGVDKSVHDYAVGLESGMDSNGRKNRSGKMGELFLEKVLADIAKERNWLYCGQTDSKKVKEHYKIDLEDVFENRRFDGSLFNPKIKKLYLFEVNNFNSGGSKSKSSATEFKDLHNRFSRTNHEFIYITDGRGWDSDQSHLKEAMEYIGKVFNYKMVESGYLKDFLKF